LYRAKLALATAARAPSQNCKAAILAANEKETAAKIAALQLAPSDTPATTETEFAAGKRVGN
jgi:hypothetical protein